MDELMIPKDGVNPYAEHPGFVAPTCPLRYTVTRRGCWGGVMGGFGCEITGGHCLPGEHCAGRRENAARHDAFVATLQAEQVFLAPSD